MPISLHSSPPYWFHSHKKRCKPPFFRFSFCSSDYLDFKKKGKKRTYKKKKKKKKRFVSLAWTLSVYVLLCRNCSCQWPYGEEKKKKCMPNFRAMTSCNTKPQKRYLPAFDWLWCDESWWLPLSNNLLLFFWCLSFFCIYFLLVFHLQFFLQIYQFLFPNNECCWIWVSFFQNKL